MKKLFSRKMNVFVLGAILLFSGCATSEKYTVSNGIEEAEASGTVTLELKEWAIGIGRETGDGVFTYQGEEYPFRLSGFDYGSISKVSMTAKGNVFNLDKLSDFEGIYLQAKASLSVGQMGKSGIFLVNKRGVTIHLKSEKEKGFDLTLGRGGIKIKFKEKPEEPVVAAKHVALPQPLSSMPIED